MPGRFVRFLRSRTLLSPDVPNDEWNILPFFIAYPDIAVEWTKSAGGRSPLGPFIVPDPPAEKLSSRFEPRTARLSPVKESRVTLFFVQDIKKKYLTGNHLGDSLDAFRKKCFLLRSFSSDSSLLDQLPCMCDKVLIQKRRQSGLPFFKQAIDNDQTRARCHGTGLCSNAGQSNQSDSVSRARTFFRLYR